MPNDQFMQKALDYIDKNIDGNISLYDISCEAGFSVPHFYRLFKKLTGDTVCSYMLRRKLSLAAKDIRDSRKSISSIAFEYGFESHDVFTRAFTRVYGISPSKYRREGKDLPPLKRLIIEEGKLSQNERQMTFDLFKSPEFEVIGMECRAKTWDSDGAIGRLWGDFLMDVEKIKYAGDPAVMYGICEWEGCDGEYIKYLAGVGVKSGACLPQGMVRRSVRTQSFFRANVPDSISVPDAYTGTIGYAKSLGFEIEEYDNIEVYEEKFRDPAYYSFQLLIPVKE